MEKSIVEINEKSGLILEGGGETHGDKATVADKIKFVRK